MDRIEFQLSDVHQSRYNHRYAISLSLHEFLAISSFPQLLPRRKTDMVASYSVVPYLQHCYAWVVTSSAVHNY